MKVRSIFCLSFLLGLFVPTLLFAVEADQIVIDGKFDAWDAIPIAVKDPEDQDNNPDGDYKSLKVASNGKAIFFLETVYGEITPMDGKRYYYHILIDVDNKLKTGISNDEYEGKPTKVKKPIGSEFYVQIGRGKGQVEFGSNGVTHLETEQQLTKEIEWKNGGDSLEIVVPFSSFGKYEGLFKVGLIISIAPFQEGQANDWAIDWTESAEHQIGKAYPVKAKDKLPLTWAKLKRVK